MAAGTSMILLFMSTTSAASIATSVPAPMAIPISAVVRAGASLMPSPVITTRPCSLSLSISLALASGYTPAMTSSTPASDPIAAAVRSLSPVNITTCMPIFLSCDTASVLSSFKVSATAIIPSMLLPSAKIRGVLPCSERSSARFPASRSPSSSEQTSFIYDILPPYIFCPDRDAVRPLPGIAEKSTVSSVISIFLSSHSPITALERGCSLFDSSAPAILSNTVSSLSVSDDIPAGRDVPSLNIGMISVTTGVPFVMVPVLSNTTMSALPVCSSDTAVLNSIPFLAPTPFPTIIATGVASPRAHGQLMTSTEMALATANPAVCPMTIHMIKVNTAIPMTTGTNTPDTLSAILAMGALVDAASFTIRIICESVVSSPTLTALHLRNPELLIVAADTRDPTVLSTGMLSPVSDDSSTAEIPSVTTPSTGMLSPGLITNISPTPTCSTGTSFSSPSCMILAVLGARRIRLLSASVVLPLDLASNSLPTVMRVSIIAADSKYRS